jgi:hypothetical protein
MRRAGLWLLAAALAGVATAQAETAPTPGECGETGGGTSRCLYRSMVPSAGLISECRDDSACRVGVYHGRADHATWFTPPAGMAALPRPAVTWYTAGLAEARFACGAGCAFSYFFEVRRQRISSARWGVLAVDPLRLLAVAAEEQALVGRQIFSGREVARIERPWAAARWLGEVVTAARMDPDGRLTFTWLKGPERTPVTERVSIPSIPR